MEPTRRNPKFHASNISAGLFAFALLASAAPALGQDSAEAAFYKGKTVTIITSTGAGGGYDFVARLLARSMPKNMPGAPTMIVQNMPGGGNVVATNYMYEVAPKDGTAIAVVNNAVPLNQVMDGRGVRFDSSKFNWIGSTGGRNEAIFILSSAGISSVDDLKTKEAVLGGTAPGSSIVIFPMAMNRVLGTKFRIVTGYKSSAEVFLAMDRGEIVARSGTLPSLQTGFPHWLAENRIRFLAQVGLVRDRELPDVPLLTELAQTDEQRRVLALISSPPALGQPYLAPPGVPGARVDTLRAAFAKTIAEPDFVAEAGKAGIDIMPMTAGEVAKIIDEVVNADPEIIRQARAALAN